MDEEETEIADYNPIPRPTMYSSNSLHMKYNDNSGEESESVDSDNSNDSDTPVVKKKKPMVKRPKLAFQQKRNKYNIWCSELQESKLTEELGNCDVRQSYQRTRDVESYNYKLAQNWDKEQSDQAVNYSRDGGHPDHKVGAGNKRTIKDRGNIKLRLGRRSSMEVENPSSGPPRSILNLNVTVNDSVEDIASDIANKLCEQKDDLILKVVETAGKQKAIDLFLETQKIERNGGMMIMNGSRRRTPGGVFLQLVKRDTDIPYEKQKQIFADDKKRKSTEKKYSHSMLQKQKAEELRRSLSADSMLRERNLPPLATRTELVLKQLTEDDHQTKGAETYGEAQVTNPPPSPATDGRENSSDGLPDMIEPTVVNRQITTYEDDDFLDIACDNMDVL